jgi:NAD(P)-dependent dehydrogenase (short-subunit alcohol dehydrogenase family)
MTQTVVITGACAGIGRATARMFGQRGAPVALIARGLAGLDAAGREVDDAGGRALQRAGRPGPAPVSRVSGSGDAEAHTASYPSGARELTESQARP